MTIDVSPRPPVPEVYLGDGLYASFDGFQVQLRAPRGGEDHVVFLEPGVLQAFLEFVKRVPWGRDHE
jgi:hypothetical protein